MQGRIALVVSSALAAACLAAACSPDAPGWRVTRSDSAGVELARVEVLPKFDDAEAAWEMSLLREAAHPPKDPSATPALYDPQDGIVLSDGTIVVQDAADDRLVVLRGDSVIRFGKYGNGPGEIAAQAPILVPTLNGGFYVVELWGNLRVHHFSASGDLLSDVRVARSGMWPASLGRTASEITIPVLGVGPDGRSASDSVARLDLETGLVQPFAPLAPDVPYQGRQPMQHPFDLWASFTDGRVVVGRTDQSFFRQYSHEGKLQRVIYLPMKPRPLSEADKLELARAARDLGIPIGLDEKYHSHWRLALRLETVDDTLFALVHRRHLSGADDPVLDGSREIWRIISVSGVPRGNIAFPANFSAWSVGNGQVLGAMRDSMGVSTVQIYSLRQPLRD